MKREIINPAMRELRAAINEAEELSGKAELSKRDESRINVLLAKIAALRSGAVAPSDWAQRWMRDFVKGRELPAPPAGEVRSDFLVGTQSISYTEGAEGGFFVPNEINDTIIAGLAKFDPLLDPNVVTLQESPTFALRPFTVPGVDLSTFAAVKVAEGAQQNPLTIPPVSGVIENGYTYRANLDASFEFEEDNFKPTMDLMNFIWSIGFARGIGKDLVNGNGTTAPQGIMNCTNSGVSTSGMGIVTETDINAIYFSVDAAYRALPKCAWAMSDAVYEQVRKAVDDQHRPLINVVGDKELLMGKPVLISPSISSAIGQPGIVFGDFGHYVVRLSHLRVARSMQAPGYVDKGKALFTALQRADAKIVDPTSGSKPPLVYATLFS